MLVNQFWYLSFFLAGLLCGYVVLLGVRGGGGILPKGAGR